MDESGFYKFVNGEWHCALNGIILPYTTELVADPEILAANGWVFMDSKPINDPE